MTCDADWSLKRKIIKKNKLSVCLFSSYNNLFPFYSYDLDSWSIQHLLSLCEP